jgi:hypothetical protein
MFLQSLPLAAFNGRAQPLRMPLSEAHQDAVGNDEDGEGDGEAAVAGSVQGRHCRAEDDQFDPQPYERHGHRGARCREQPQRTAATSGAPIPSAVLVTSPPSVRTPQ